MGQKKTHFGRAGEFYAMSELLLRGWNVAVPVVDVGDDIFVIDDNDTTTWRLQVKSAKAEPVTEAAGQPPTRWRGQFQVSRKQLSTPQAVELFYLLLLRQEQRWRFLVIPRAELLRLRQADLARERTGRGGRPVPDHLAANDALNFRVEFTAEDAVLWGGSLRAFLDRWPPELPEVQTGPGATTPAPTAPAAADPAP